MKRETNNEMDLLLRRLGRRSDLSVSGTNGDVDHLDTDELNAYAENVLPAAARARYTEHLAECARCRGLVVQLTSSAGVLAAQTSRVPEPSALRKFLAGFFSPLVLRYAVPALGLIVVAAIGFVIVRQRQSERPAIAQNAETPKTASITAEQAPKPPEGNLSYSEQKQAPDSAAKTSDSPASGSPVGGSPASGSPDSRPASPEASPNAGFVADTSEDSPGKKAEAQPSDATAPKPAATVAGGQLQAETEARQDVASRGLANEPPAEKTVEAAKAEDRKLAAAQAPSAAAANETKPLGMAGPQGVARSRGRREDTEARDKDEAAAVTVAGRHFRKQGSAWVDTAYNSSRSLTSVRRGSEQYRALIADEPAIKTIADQLDGEVIVVWKNRAYRIQ